MSLSSFLTVAFAMGWGHFLGVHAENFGRLVLLGAWHRPGGRLAITMTLLMLFVIALVFWSMVVEWGSAVLLGLLVTPLTIMRERDLRAEHEARSLGDLKEIESEADR